MGSRAAILVLVLAVTAASPARSAGEERRDNAWLGIFLGDALDGGVQIVAVMPDGPAALGGLRRGDVVLAVGDSETADRLVLGEAVDDFYAGESIPIRILRNGHVRELTVTAGRSPTAHAWSVRPEAPPVRTPALQRVLERPFGMELREIPPELRSHMGGGEGQGILVARVGTDSPASRGGVRVGDLLVRVAGRPVTRVIDLAIAASTGESGGVVLVEAVRDRSPIRLRIEARGSSSADSAGSEPAEARDEILRAVRRREDEIRRLREEVEALRKSLEETREVQNGKAR
jgi:S1-C subfamily serine protease